MIIFLRVLRIARVLRLVKLMHSPFLKDLANMLVGLMIGVPALCWVLVLFISVLYTFGLLLRYVLGPAADQNYLGLCGPADMFDEAPVDPNCPVHFIYGEEFFGSLSSSMFTTFRFMIGDFSTRGGKSLAVIFSQGYGTSFNVVYCMGMIGVMFGLFNIITAIFVDSTIAGLKHNDVKRKYAKQYEKHYVQAKLRQLMYRVSEVVAARRGDAEPRKTRYSTISRHVEDRMVELTEDDFIEVMEDPMVKVLLQDLDVEMYNPPGMFDTFDPHGNKIVTLSEMVQVIMKLRGAPQKNDMIASWVAIRALHNKVDDLFSSPEHAKARCTRANYGAPMHANGRDRRPMLGQLLT